jgi:hypothetical protein
LFGEGFDVTQLASSEGDFMATTSNSYFVAYDNVDTYCKWLNDNLACSATGAQYGKREYYTTNTSVKFTPKCFLGLSSRTPNFKRADVADRLLLFRVDKREKFKGQKRLLTQIKRKRRSLMSEIMDNLNCIIAYLREDDEAYESTHRMADFAELIYKINIALDGEEGKVEELLTNMDMERNAFVLEGNQFYEFLCIWMDDNEGRIVEIRHLYDDFKKISEEHKYEFKCKSTNSLTKQFRAVYNELLDKFDIDIDKGNKPCTYTFNYKPIDDEPETGGKPVFKKRHHKPRRVNV